MIGLLMKRWTDGRKEQRTDGWMEGIFYVFMNTCLGA